MSADAIAQLQVLSQENGCLLDLSAILNSSICPKIDLKTHSGQVEQHGDYVSVTPTETDQKEKRCDDSCSDVSPEVCQANHVGLDLEILLVFGLLTEDELEKYLKTLGEMDQDDHLHMANDQNQPREDPLLSANVGGKDGLVNLDVAGKDGLVDLDLGGKDVVNVGGKNGLLDVNLRRRGEGLDKLASVNVGGQKDPKPAPIDVGVLTHSRLRRRGQGLGRLADVDVGGQKDPKPAPIDVDALTHSRRGQGLGRLADVDVGGQKDPKPAPIDVDALTHSRRGQGLGRLADVDVGGQKDPKPAPIDVDALTHSRRGQGLDRLADVDVGGQRDPKPAPIDVDALTHSRRADKGLLDLDVGGEKDDQESVIDIDLLTHGGKNDGGGNDGGNGSGNGGNGGNGSNGGHDGHDGHEYPDYISIYQPICNKGFKKENRDHAESCHAQDANHCLAICHSQGALLTLKADAQVGDVANILLCAAVEFDQSNDGDNCHYFVAPENEPGHDDQLEDNENSYTFVRN